MNSVGAYFRRFVLLLLVIGLASNTAFAQETGRNVTSHAERIAGFSARAVYNLDADQLRAVVEGYLVDQKDIAGLSITETIDNERLLTYFRDDTGGVFGQTIPDEIASLARTDADVIYENEKIGVVTVYRAPITSVPLSAEEQSWIAANPVIRVHNETDWPPFDFNENGKPLGFSVEYMNRLADSVGLQVEYVTGPTWNDFLKMIRAKQLDVMMNIVRTPDREKYILFTDPYVDNPPVIIVRNDDDSISNFNDLRGKSVCLSSGYFYQEIIERGYPDISLALRDDQAACLEAVSFGRVDATLGGLAVQNYLIREKLLSNLRVAGGIDDDAFSNKLRIGVRDDWPVLRSILQKAIAALPHAEISALKAAWLGEAQDLRGGHSMPAAPRDEVSLFNVALLIAGVTIGLALLLVGVGWVLRRTIGDDVEDIFQSAQARFVGMLLVGLFLAAMVAGAWVALQRMEQEVRQETGATLTTVLHTTHESLRNWAAKEVEAVKLLAQSDDLQQLTELLLSGSADPEAVRNIINRSNLRLFMTAHSIAQAPHSFAIIDRNGATVGASEEANLGRVSEIYAQRQTLFERVLDGESLLIPPVRSPVISGKRASDAKTVSQNLFFASPIENRRGDIVAVLAMPQRIEEDFARIIKLGRPGESGETYAFDKAGFLVSPSRFDAMLQSAGLIKQDETGALNLQIRDPGGNLLDGYKITGNVANLPFTEMAASATTGESGMDIAGYRDYRGIPVLGAWVWDDVLNIGLAAEIDEAEALNAYLTLRDTIIVLLSISVLLGLGLTGLSVWAGQSATAALGRARDNLEVRVKERTEELADREKLLRTAMENMSDGMFMLDANMRYVLMNKRYRQLMDFDEEFIGNGIKVENAVLAHAIRGDYGEGDVDELVRARLAALSSAEPSEREMHLAESAKVLQLRKAPIDGGGAVVVVSDVTDVTEAREELTRSEEEVRLILESIGEGVFGVDLDGCVSFANSRALNLLGFTSDELIGQKVHALIHHTRADGANYPVEECPMWRAYTAGDSSRIDNEVLWRKDGTSFPVEYSATPILRDGEIRGAVVAFNDVTERRKVENRLRSVIETASDGIIVIDDQGIVLTFSPAAERIFGYPASEVIGKNVSMLMPDRFGSEHDGFIQHYHDTGERRIVGTNREVAGLRKDGTAFPMDLAVGEATLGEVQIFTGLVRDITERKEAERRLSDAYNVISDSITYASRIQQAVMTGEEMLRATTADCFVIWQPRDVVGGDIYWCHPWGQGVLIIAADCTGHGVPGAFMTLIATGALDRAIGEVEPGSVGHLVRQMHLVVQFTLNQHGGAGDSDDGLDLGACYIDFDQSKLTFSGAKLPLFIVENGEVTEVKATRSGIGYRGISATQTFDEQVISLTGAQTFYMTSDGLVDQIGGEKRRGFGKKRFKETLLAVENLPLSQQRAEILDRFSSYQGDENRRDDVTAIGFRP